MSTAHPKLGEVFPDLALLKKEASGLKPGTLIKLPPKKNPQEKAELQSVAKPIKKPHPKRSNAECAELRVHLYRMAMEKKTLNDMADELQAEFPGKYGKYSAEDLYYQIHHHLVRVLKVPARPQDRVYPVPQPEPSAVTIEIKPKTPDATPQYDFDTPAPASEAMPEVGAAPYAKASLPKADLVAAQALVAATMPAEIQILTGKIDLKSITEFQSIQKQFIEYFGQLGFNVFIRHKDGGPETPLS